MTRYPPERQHEITRLLVASRGRLGVQEIAAELRVTTETVRRDLDVLERRGTLRRVRGGAELRQAAPFEQALAERHAEQRAEKNQIAQRLVAELPADGVVIIDSGSLTYLLGPYLPTDRPLVVVTNNLPLAQFLSGHENLQIITLPGMVRGLTSASVDAWTTRRLRSLTADLSIMGVNGLTPEMGLTTTNPEEAATKRAMLLAGRRRLLPVVSAKLGRNSFCSFAEVRETDVIITDAGADADLVAELGALGPEVVVLPAGAPRGQGG